MNHCKHNVKTLSSCVEAHSIKAKEKEKKWDKNRMQTKRKIEWLKVKQKSICMHFAWESKHNLWRATKLFKQTEQNKKKQKKNSDTHTHRE